jgi:hypothetical protein
MGLPLASNDTAVLLQAALRLVPGRVERSDDNTNFRTLVEQDRRCNLGPID